MTLTISLVNIEGETANLVVNEDRTFNPQILDPAKPVVVSAEASSRSEIVRITVRIDYLLFVGEAPSGLYPDRLHRHFLTEKSQWLNDIRRRPQNLWVSGGSLGLRETLSSDS
jgi:hypothetical protein